MQYGVNEFITHIRGKNGKAWIKWRVTSGPHLDVAGKTYFIVYEVCRKGMKGRPRKNVVFHVPQS